MQKPNIFSKRIEKISNSLKSTNNSALVVGSAPERIRSYDTMYPFRQESYMLYLTGSTDIKNSILLVTSKLSECILVTKKKTATEILWEGKGTSSKLLAKSLKINYIECNDPVEKCIELLKSYNSIFFSFSKESLVHKLINNLIIAKRNSNISSFHYASEIIDRFRAIKDSEEINKIVKAIEVTSSTLDELPRLLSVSSFEKDIAESLTASYARHGCEHGFQPIVATGASAAVLHYNDYNKKCKLNDLVLIDTGAEYENYCSDITRCYPISKTYSKLQSALYSIVLEANKASIELCSPNMRIFDIHMTAVKIIIKGLIKLKILSGSVQKNIKTKDYLRFFPHGIGHSLGIDTHDVPSISCSNKDFRLKSGMVFTIEPGIYFNKRIAGFPAMGIRIEDNILVTKKGPRVLTSSVPKEIKDIEYLMKN